MGGGGAEGTRTASCSGSQESRLGRDQCAGCLNSGHRVPRVLVAPCPVRPLLCEEWAAHALPRGLSSQSLRLRSECDPTSPSAAFRTSEVRKTSVLSMGHSSHGTRDGAVFKFGGQMPRRGLPGQTVTPLQVSEEPPHCPPNLHPQQPCTRPTTGRTASRLDWEEGWGFRHVLGGPAPPDQALCPRVPAHSPGPWANAGQAQGALADLSLEGRRGGGGAPTAESGLGTGCRQCPGPRMPPGGVGSKGLAAQGRQSRCRPSEPWLRVGAPEHSGKP